MKNVSKLLLIFSFFGISTALFAAGEVIINSNLKVEADGTIVSSGAATVWNDINVYPDANSTAGNNPPSWARLQRNGSSQGVFLWSFSGTQEQEVFFQVQIPHSYKVGTDLKPHVHWTTTTGTPLDNVTWALEYTIMKSGGNFDVTTTATGTNTVPAVPSGTLQHLITPLTTISGANIEISTILVCRLYRPVVGGFTNGALLLGFDIHYESDMTGSHSDFTK